MLNLLKNSWKTLENGNDEKKVHSPHIFQPSEMCIHGGDWVINFYFAGENLKPETIGAMVLGLLSKLPG